MNEQCCWANSFEEFTIGIANVNMDSARLLSWCSIGKNGVVYGVSVLAWASLYIEESNYLPVSIVSDDTDIGLGFNAPNLRDL